MHIMSISSDLHRHLADWRTLKGFSQEQVAEALRVNKSTVHRWEKGKRAVDLGDLERLSQLFEVDPTALLLSPADHEMAIGLTRAKRILEVIPAAAGKRWLETGEDIAGEKLSNRQHAA